MSAPTRERCWECGRPVTPDDAECPACGTVQTALCESCGATFSVYADACPSCEHAHDSFAFRPAVTRRRVVVFLLLAAAVAAGVYGFRVWRQDEGRERRTEFVEASMAYEQHRFEVARNGFSGFLSRWGDEEKAWYMLALSLWRLDRVDEAVNAARTALELRPRYPEAALFLAERARERGDPERALELAGRALAASPAPTDADAHLLAGRLLSEPPLLDLAGAVEHLRSAVRLGVDSPDVLLLLADLAGRKLEASPSSESRGEIQGWLERARAGIEARRGQDPTNPDLLFLLARIEYRIEEIRPRRTEERPDYSTPAANLELARRHALDTPPERARKDVLLGKLAWKRMGKSRARQIFDGLLDVQPTAPLLAEIAEFYLDQGEELGASGVLAQAIARFPTDPVFRLLQIRRHLARGDLETAAAAIEDARATLPRQPDLALLDGLTKRWAGDLAAAEEILRETADRAAAGPDEELHLVDLLLEAGKVGEATERLRRANRDGDPDDALALFREYLGGKLDLIVNDTEGAIGKLDRVIGSMDRDVAAHYLLAQAHARRREHDMAVMETDSVIRKAGESWELHVERGEARLAAGEAKLAAEDADAALVLRSDAEAALLLRARARPETARADLELSLSGEGPRIRTRVELAGRLRDAGEADRARELLDAAWARAESESDRLLVTGAAGDFERHLSEFPGDARARVARAVRLLDDGRLEEAAREARRALGDDPDGIDARLVLFETCFDGWGPAPGTGEAARGLAEEILRLGTDLAAGRYVRGKLALARGDLPAAVEDLEAAVRSRPDRTRFRFARGVAAHLVGDREEARIALRRAGAAGRAVLERPRDELLLELARRALDRDPSSEAGCRWLRLALDAIREPAARVAPALALLSAEPDPPVAALEALAAASDPVPGDPRAGPVADGLFLTAVARERAGDAAGAEALYRRALALRPAHVPAATNLSLILAARGGAAADEAVALARDAVGRDGERAEVRLALATALRARAGEREAVGRSEEAASDREEATRLSGSRQSR